MSTLSLKQRKQASRQLKNKETKRYEDRTPVHSILWHYTCGDRLEKILKSGEIRPATAGIEKGERPAVWFSTNPVWEQTANKLLMDSLTGRVHAATKQETHEYCGGLARIAVAPETAPINWADFCTQSGISSKFAAGLKKVAYSMGSRPSQWFVSFSSVLRDKWLAIEIWDGEKWIPVPKQEKRSLEDCGSGCSLIAESAEPSLVAI
jgi:hypothetical protein